MSQTAVALVVLAALVSLVQWLWVRMAEHVDLQLMPAHSRRHVHWLLAHSARVQYAALALVGCATAVEMATILN